MELKADTEVANMGDGWSGHAEVIVEFSDLHPNIQEYIRVLEEKAFMYDSLSD